MDARLTIILTGCPAPKGPRPTLTFRDVSGINYTTYSWSALAAVMGDTSSSGGMSIGFTPAPAAPALPQPRPGISNGGLGGGGGQLPASSPAPGMSNDAAIQRLIDALAQQQAGQGTGAYRYSEAGSSGTGYDGGSSSSTSSRSSSGGGSYSGISGGSGDGSSSGSGGSNSGVGGSGGVSGSSSSSSSGGAYSWGRPRALGAAAPSAPSVTVALNQVGTVAVRTEFTRRVSAQAWTYSGTIIAANPDSRPVETGPLTVVVVFGDGSSAQIKAACPPAAERLGGRRLTLPAAPDSLVCSWALAQPLGAPLAGQAIALLDGTLPLITSKIIQISFDGGKSEVSGACAAISADWGIENSDGSGVLVPQPKIPPASAASAAPRIATEVCDSKAFAWGIQIGPLSAQQCPAAARGGLMLVGTASAQPTSGAQMGQGSAVRSKVVLTGCPPASAGR